MTKLPSLGRYLLLTFTLINAILFAVCLTLLWINEELVEKITLEHWLQAEVEFYNQQWQKLGDQAAKPNQLQFTLYWSESNNFPNWLRPYQESGFFEDELADEDKHFLVAEHPSKQGLIYLVFNDDADDFLDPYEDMQFMVLWGFGVLLLGTALHLYLRSMRSIISSLNFLVLRTGQLMPGVADFTPTASWRELHVIETALLQSKQKIAYYFQREQEFSRFASHELRTPNMVIRGSVELLLQLEQLPPTAQRAIIRIQEASAEMALLTEALLMLGHNEKLELETFNAAAEIHTELTFFHDLFERSKMRISLTLDDSSVKATRPFFRIIISNLLKNSLNYGSDEVSITLNKGVLTITNPTLTSIQESQGYGCGLIIIQRICDRLGWIFTHGYQNGIFSAHITFRRQLN